MLIWEQWIMSLSSRAFRWLEESWIALALMLGVLVCFPVGIAVALVVTGECG